jgi:CRP-like cAMP-binding protein
MAQPPHPPHLTLVEKPKLGGNRLLMALSDDDRALLQPSLVLVTLKRGEVMITPNEPITHVYFPIDCLGSIVAITRDKRRIEVGIFGREGMSSTSLLHGTNTTPHENFTQVEGTALHMGADDLRSAIRQSPSLHEVLLRYVEAFQVQVAYTALSHGSFTIEERLARWLLMCHDRLPGDDLPLVHEFLSMMLGVRRSGVTIAIQTLEGTGAIRATRGHIVVHDRATLEETANGSYGVPEAEYRRLIGEW